MSLNPKRPSGFFLLCVLQCAIDFANMHRDFNACTHLQFSWAHKNCCEWSLPNVQIARQTAQVVQVLLYMLLPCAEFHVPFIPSFFQCHLLCLWQHFKLLCGELEGSTNSTNSDWFLHPSTIHPWNSHLQVWPPFASSAPPQRTPSAALVRPSAGPPRPGHVDIMFDVDDILLDDFYVIINILYTCLF